AYVVAQPRLEPNRIAMRAYLAQRLPDYMQPATFVFLTELPLTPSGKVDRRALPPPPPDRDGRISAYVAPRTATEALVAELCAEALDLERVSVADAFFDLGGHSLAAMRVLNGVRKLLHVDLPLSAFFDAATPAGLARRLAGQQAKAGDGAA